MADSDHQEGMETGVRWCPEEVYVESDLRAGARFQPGVNQTSTI